MKKIWAFIRSQFPSLAVVRHPRGFFVGPDMIGYESYVRADGVRVARNVASDDAADWKPCTEAQWRWCKSRWDAVNASRFSGGALPTPWDAE